MRWLIFAIWAYLLLALQVSLAEMVAIPTAFGLVEPRFMLSLAVFVGLSASPSVVYAALFMIGLALDVTRDWPLPDGTAVTLIGPYTLGYLAGAYTILELRGMMFRYHPMTIGSMIVASGIAVMLIVVALCSARGWYEAWANWNATDELVRRAIGLLYSGAIGMVLTWPMVKMAPLFGFSGQQSRGRRFSR